MIRDIFRRYPHRYEKVIITLCENLEALDEPEPKCAMIWIIGEYAERIEDADERLQFFIDTFAEENTHVQLQILTAAVKLFLKKPDKAKAIVQNVLNMATEKSDNPDLRDRGYMYWRLLSSDPATAKVVVLADRPVISSEEFGHLSKQNLDEYLRNISMLSSVFHELPQEFVRGYRGIQYQAYEGEEESEESSSSSTGTEEESGDRRKRRKRQKEREREKEQERKEKGRSRKHHKEMSPRHKEHRDRDREREREKERADRDRHKRHEEKERRKRIERESK